ncbi:MAG: sulfate ABC transporter substrate-binding protein, partial [Candidatus Nitrosocosmicus sp.]|nr:sulfate ABC transporter substrate-binding protein [Candidatus Nitrosocosmicus sp.]
MRSELKLAISGFIIIAVIVSSNSDLNIPLLSGNDGRTDEFGIENTNTKSDSLRIAYFPNLNHAPAIIQQGNGDFSANLDKYNLSNITISSTSYASKNSIIEALYGDKIDVAYVNPSTII